MLSPLLKLCPSWSRLSLCGSCFIPVLLKNVFLKSLFWFISQKPPFKAGKPQSLKHFRSCKYSVVSQWGGGCRPAACKQGVAECFLLWSALSWCDLHVVKCTTFKRTIQWTLTDSHVIGTTITMQNFYHLCKSFLLFQIKVLVVLVAFL